MRLFNPPWPPAVSLYEDGRAKRRKRSKRRDESRTSVYREKKLSSMTDRFCPVFSYCTTNDPRAYSTWSGSSPTWHHHPLSFSRDPLFPQFPPRYTSSPCICFPDHSWLLRFRPLPLSSHNLSLSVSPLPDLLRKPRRKEQRRLSNA
ncbi:hypothetical protein K0M31_013502 [Melipona bicolor]|uniref:Uncharacterized protein n=1 Tax=Melipona bicolor TaxID=60889 RepID=A0AA40KGI0_9HYME|nr:hypothetical protein K0M31_013502 [Melipona bicolor]